MIAIRVTCDGAGCGRHFDAAVPQGIDELVDLSSHTERSFALELFLSLPDGWLCVGRQVSDDLGFVVMCADHVTLIGEILRELGGTYDGGFPL